MRKFIVPAAILVGTTALFAYAGPKHRPSQESKVIGFTETRVTGGASFSLVEACEVEFPGSHICTPRDVMRTSVAPEGLGDGSDDWAWIDGTQLQQEGFSLACGIGYVPVFQGSFGAAIKADGSFAGIACSASLQVACCDRPGRWTRD